MVEQSVMITLIISGGQTGADQAGLRAGKARGLATTGFMPKGWLTEDGDNPYVGLTYGMIEHETRHDYAPRTKANVEMADATVIFGRRSRGSNLTERTCQLMGKPHLWIAKPGPASIIKLKLWLKRTNPSSLNIAGNRESVSPGIGQWVENLLLQVL